MYGVKGWPGMAAWGGKWCGMAWLISNPRSLSLCSRSCCYYRFRWLVVDAHTHISFLPTVSSVLPTITILLFYLLLFSGFIVAIHSGTGHFLHAHTPLHTHTTLFPTPTTCYTRTPSPFPYHLHTTHTHHHPHPSYHLPIPPPFTPPPPSPPTLPTPTLPPPPSPPPPSPLHTFWFGCLVVCFGDVVPVVLGVSFCRLGQYSVGGQ